MSFGQSQKCQPRSAGAKTRFAKSSSSKALIGFCALDIQPQPTLSSSFKRQLRYENLWRLQKRESLMSKVMLYSQDKFSDIDFRRRLMTMNFKSPFQLTFDGKILLWIPEPENHCQKLGLLFYKG